MHGVQRIACPQFKRFLFVKLWHYDKCPRILVLNPFGGRVLFLQVAFHVALPFVGIGEAIEGVDMGFPLYRHASTSFTSLVLRRHCPGNAPPLPRSRIHWVPLTTSKKMQKKLLVTSGCSLFNITVNYFDAKKSVPYIWVLVKSSSYGRANVQWQ